MGLWRTRFVGDKARCSGGASEHDAEVPSEPSDLAFASALLVGILEGLIAFVGIGALQGSWGIDSVS